MIDNRDKQIMIEMRNEGMTYSAIAKKFGLDHTTVIYHLKNPDRSVQNKRGINGRVMITPDYKLKNENTFSKLKVSSISSSIKNKRVITAGRGENYDEIMKRQKKVKLVRDEVGNVIK